MTEATGNSNKGFVFDSALVTDEINGKVHVKPLCRSYAQRVIGAGKLDYLDVNGVHCEVNVFRGAFRNRLLAIALVADYKAMSLALGQDSSGVTWENVTNRYKTVYTALEQSLTVSGSCDFTKVKATWTAYVDAVKTLIPDMCKDVLNELKSKDAFLTEDAIPEQQDPLSETGTSPLWVGDRPNIAIGKIMAAVKFSQVNGSMFTGGKINTHGVIYGAVQK